MHRKKYARLREEVLEIERTEVERVAEVVETGKVGALGQRLGQRRGPVIDEHEDRTDCSFRAAALKAWLER
jgi:hypothetical protein